MRLVMVRVLPVPAPASTHTGPRGARTAALCSGSSPSTAPPLADTAARRGDSGFAAEVG